MAFRTLLKFRNLDVTSDINDQLRTLINKGIFDGGQVTPVAGSLEVDVQPFKSIGNEGMVTLLEGAPVRVSVTAGVTQFVLLHAEYKPNATPISDIEVLTDTAFAALTTTEQAARIKIAKITLPISATEVSASQIDLRESDFTDQQIRFFLRGSTQAKSDLPDFTDPPTGDTTGNRIGDVFYVEDDRLFYAWQLGPTTAVNEWLQIISTAAELRLDDHKQNIDDGTVPPDFFEAQHVTVAFRLSHDEGSASTKAFGGLPIPAGTSFGTNNAIMDERYPIGVRTRTEFTGLSNDTQVQLTGQIYVGTGAITTAEQHFRLATAGTEQQFVGTDNNPITVLQIRDETDTSPVTPSNDADSLGFIKNPIVLFDLSATSNPDVNGSVSVLHGIENFVGQVTPEDSLEPLSFGLNNTASGIAYAGKTGTANDLTAPIASAPADDIGGALNFLLGEVDKRIAASGGVIDVTTAFPDSNVTALVTQGGNTTALSTGGIGIDARGGSNTANKGGIGVKSTGGNSTSGGDGGDGVVGTGGTGSTDGIGVRGVGGGTGGIGVLGQGQGSVGDGIRGINSSSGTGVRGTSVTGEGVLGESASTGAGGTVTGTNTGAGGVGVWGSNDSAGIGVFGLCTSGAGVGVRGHGTVASSIGVLGEIFTAGGAGVKGEANVATGVGVLGEATTGIGVRGDATSIGGTGIWGEALVVSGTGVIGLGNARGGSFTGSDASATGGEGSRSDGGDSTGAGGQGGVGVIALGGAGIGTGNSTGGVGVTVTGGAGGGTTGPGGFGIVAQGGAGNGSGDSVGGPGINTTGGASSGTNQSGGVGINAVGGARTGTSASVGGTFSPNASAGADGIGVRGTGTNQGFGVDAIGVSNLVGTGAALKATGITDASAAEFTAGSTPRILQLFRSSSTGSTPAPFNMPVQSGFGTPLIGDLGVLDSSGIQTRTVNRLHVGFPETSSTVLMKPIEVMGITGTADSGSNNFTTPQVVDNGAFLMSTGTSLDGSRFGHNTVVRFNINMLLLTQQVGGTASATISILWGDNATDATGIPIALFPNTALPTGSSHAVTFTGEIVFRFISTYAAYSVTLMSIILDPTFSTGIPPSTTTQTTFIQSTNVNSPAGINYLNVVGSWTIADSTNVHVVRSASFSFA